MSIKHAFGRVNNQGAGQEKEVWSGSDGPSTAAPAQGTDCEQPEVQEPKAVVRGQVDGG